jgi:hypothetical protein
MLTRAIDEAVTLLRDNEIVWGSEMQLIRLQLADLLIVCAAQGEITQTLADNLAKKITEPTVTANYNPGLELR